MVTGKLSDGPPQDLTHWLLGAIATLAGFIAAMWKRNESKNAQDILKLEERIAARDALIDKRDAKIDKFENHANDCDEKLRALQIQMAGMQGQISRNKADVDRKEQDHT